MRTRFGDFLLDDGSFRLMRGGRPVALRRKVFDLLVVLVRERERVVTREELVGRLWSSTTVGAGSLSGLVNELRAALGEGGRGPSSIRTVHARGYQFTAPVIVESPESPEAAETSESPAPALAGILRALAQADASAFEAALRSLGFEGARFEPIRAARRVEPAARYGEGRSGTEGI